jgi:hypothetical protein
VDPPASHAVSVPRGTQELPLLGCVYGTLTLFGMVSHPFPLRLYALESYNPAQLVERFGLFRVRSPLLAESSLFLGLLRCFSSPGSLPLRDDEA